jgi:hypothetical protein
VLACSASKAATKTPAALYKAATKQHERPGRKDCKFSSTTAKTARAPPTGKWPRPSETEQQCEKERADEVVELKAKSPWCPFRGSEGENHERDQGGHAANLERGGGLRRRSDHPFHDNLLRHEMTRYCGQTRQRRSPMLQ